MGGGGGSWMEELTADNRAVSFDAGKRRTFMKILGEGERAECAMTFKEARAVKAL